MTEEKNKELEKVLASSIQGEIVRTKRIEETTFANLSLIHTSAKYSKYRTTEERRLKY